MHVNTVLSLTILFWIASMAAWIFSKMIIFSFKVFSTISFFAVLAIAKTSAWKTISSQIAKNSNLYESRLGIPCRNLH